MFWASNAAGFRCRSHACESQVSFSASLFQLEFSDDIVKIIQTAFNSDGGQLESRKANSMLKSFFIRVRKKLVDTQFWQ